MTRYNGLGQEVEYNEELDRYVPVKKDETRDDLEGPRNETDDTTDQGPLLQSDTQRFPDDEYDED